MLHYEIKGNGKRTLVLLHGFLESSSMWSALELHKEARLICIDLPGHGASSLDGIDSMSAMAKEVYAVLQTENITEYEILGHSMGGYVGLELAQMDEKCRRLILLNSNVWTDSPNKREDRERVAKLVQTKKARFISEAIPNLFEAPEQHQQAVRDLIAEAMNISSEAIARASLAMSTRSDYSEAVFSGEFTVFVIQGKNDSIAAIQPMRNIMEHQKNRFYVVDSGHMAHLEATASVRNVLHAIWENPYESNNKKA